MFQYPEMMLATTTQTTAATTVTSSQTTASSPAGLSMVRSSTPKSGTPVRNVFSVQPTLRARTQVEVAQAALILSRIEDMKGCCLNKT